MDLDTLSKDERIDVLAQMADLFYNQQATQIEIAKQFGTTRFKVAKLLQEARDEQVVEIKVNFSSERNHDVERQLVERFGLKSATVVDTKYDAYIDGLTQLGKAGALRVSELLNGIEEPVLGITWGKSIQTVIGQLPRTGGSGLSAVQLAGNFPSARPTSEGHELVSRAAAARLGDAYYLNTPLYVKSDSVREGLRQEPDVQATLERAKSLDVVLTGIGGDASLPSSVEAFSAYATEEDRTAAATSLGSLYGYVLDEAGHVADTPLNRKLMAVPLDDILHAPHRIGMASGRNKAKVAAAVAKNGLINELVTNAETASLMLA